MKLLAQASIILLSLAFSSGVHAISVDKINERGAKLAWNSENEIFDPNTPIPDSIAAKNSAVIIARFRSIDAHHELKPSIVKEQLTGAASNTTNVKEFTRTMIKLLDKNALERYSKFEFGEKDENWMRNLKLSSEEEGFGARIFKPDGKMIVVDLSQALPITEGKKGNKKKNYRIALPGLEIGDVIDFFYYSEEMREEFDIAARNVNFAGRYPILNYKLKCITDKELTVELRPFNGAPLPNNSIADGRNLLSIHAVNLKAIPSTKFVNERRQVPFLQMRILNNNATLRFKPKNARTGGVFVLPPETYYSDISEYLRKFKYDSGIPSRAASRVKKYIKANPDAKVKKIADYTFVSVMYEALIDKTGHNPTELAFMLRDAADKANFTAPSAVGFINSFNDVPASQITSHNAPDYMAMIGKYPYHTATPTISAPGEWIYLYHNEEGGCFRKLTEEGDNFPEMFSIPPTKPAANTRMDEITLTIDTESTKAQADVNISAVGASKTRLAAQFNNVHSWIEEAERYLGIDPKDHYIDNDFDAMKYEKDIYEAMESSIEIATGTKPASVDSVSITSRGIMPDAKSFGCFYRASFDDFSIDAGEEMIVNIGKLFSDNDRLSGDDRERSIEATGFTPYNYIRKLRIPLPEGYSISDEALAALNTAKSNNLGTFSSSAILDNNEVIIDVNRQLLAYIIPADMWPQYLELSDAAADFASAALVIKKND